MSSHFDRERELQGRIEKQLALALPEIDVLDVELDDRSELVRVFIDHEDGIGFEECTAVNDVIRDTCPDHALEVSSPGIEAPMRHPRHFRKHIGEYVRVRRSDTHKASTLKIIAVDDSDGVTFQPDNADETTVSFDKIVRCKLVMENSFAITGKQQKNKKRGDA